MWNAFLRSEGSFNDLVLHHFELLIIVEKLEKLNFFTLKATEIVCTCITSPAEASAGLVKIHLH